MSITNVLVAGSVVYAGVKTVVKQHRSDKADRFDNQPSYIRQTATTVEVESAEMQQVGVPLAERRHLALAATSFWLAVGGLLFPPLTVVSVPLTLFTTVPILEAGCRSLYVEGRLKPSVINSILLVSTLVTEHYFSAATITWLHHAFRQLGRRAQSVGEEVTFEISNELSELVRQALGGTPPMVWLVKDTVEVKVPFAEIKVGDLIVVNRSEFVPVEGTVVAGAARLNLILVTRSTIPVAVGVGERVYPTAFVVDGQLRIQVEKINE